MKRLLPILFILISYAATAQEPTLLSLKGYGGSDDDQVNTNVTQTQDGGFIINIASFSNIGTGNIDSFCFLNGYRTIFLKYNADASVLEWSKCYENTGDSFILYLFPTNDSGVILGGEFTTGGYLICKENALGNVVWSHSYSKGNSAGLRNMTSMQDGGYIMVGVSSYTDTNVLIHYGSISAYDIWALKIDSNGNKVWSVVIGGTYDNVPFSVIPGPGGGCYIYGYTNSDDHDCAGLHGLPDSATDAYLVRLDSNGHIIWHHDLGGSGIDGEYGWGIADGKGGVLLANGSNSIDGDVHNHIGGIDYWVLEVDSNNNILWDNCFGGSNADEPFSICKATDGSIWVAGQSNGKGGEVDTGYSPLNYDAWFVHADSVGNFLNAKVLGTTETNQGNMVYPLPGGLVMAGGYYGDSNGSFSSLTWYGQNDAFLAVFAPWTTGIQQITASDNTLKVYPNPSNEQVTIETTDKGTVVVTDVLGRAIYSAAINKKIQIQIKDWEKGMYFVQVISENGIKVTKKLLVE